MMPRRPDIAGLLLLAVATPSSALGQASFTDQAAAWGIAHVWQGNYNEGGGGNTGGGVALEDFDRDGDPDLFLGREAGAALQVFRNDGGVFTEITGAVGIGDIGTSKQLAFGDLDDDGWRDLIVTGWGQQIRLFRNRGDGTFEDRSVGSGLQLSIDASFPSLATGACLGDYDRDRDLDLYVSYWTLLGDPSPEATNRLFRNDGDLHFTEVTATAGVGNDEPSFQPMFTDLNGDRWPDLLVAHDKQGGISYYRNDQDGTFTDRSKESGLEGLVTTTQTYVDGMGLAVGDLDNDGDLDVYCTNTELGNVMYRNDGGGLFTEVASLAGTLSQRFAWGTGLLDCDNDGRLDLYVVDTGLVGGANRLYWNQGGFSFTDIAPAAQVADDSFGWSCSLGDLDRDGYLDLVVTNDQEFTRVYRNDGSGQHWVRLHLRGIASNRDGIGAWIEVTAGGVTQLREVQAGSSYLGHETLEQEVGLGAATVIDQLVVRWPSGQVDTHLSLPVDQDHLLVEGGAVTPTPAAPRPLFLTVGPNPVRSETTLRMQLPAGLGGRHGRLAVYDARGRRVTVLHRGPLPEGEWAVPWRAVGPGGRPLPRGVYRIQLTGPGRPLVVPVTLVR